ncbi:MAG: hypothetical protein IJ617_02490 [Oscillospiraceae bacterium]|nr:hypothetical protein [Oscillospiraceae bacterium]
MKQLENRLRQRPCPMPSPPRAAETSGVRAEGVIQFSMPANGMAAGRIYDIARGKDIDIGGTLETAASQVAPANPLNENILRAWFDADLLDTDSPGRTWYGSDIESQRLQNLAPGERYDARTDELSKWLGSKLRLSPKKINYLLDQYSGVLGDALLPLLTPTAERDMISAAFTLDSAASNRLSNDFYDMLDELTYNKNAVNATGVDLALYRFWNKQGDRVGEINAVIRQIEADESISDKDKRELLRSQYMLRNATERQALDALSEYRAAVRKHYEASEGSEEERASQAATAANKEVFGAEYAIQAAGKASYETAAELYEEGLSYEDFYTLVTAGPLTPSAAKQYLAYCKWMDAGDYAKHFAEIAGMHDIKNSEGKVTTSRKSQVVGYINRLDLLPDQKSAVFVASGYKASGLKDCPWWDRYALRSEYYPED